MKNLQSSRMRVNMGLYGGLDVDDIYKRKNLEVGQKILDYMGSTELIANLFRISQTEEKLRKGIQEIEREQMARLKAKAKAGKLMLDE